jgi:hypothetical protein
LDRARRLLDPWRFDEKIFVSRESLRLIEARGGRR